MQGQPALSTEPISPRHKPLGLRLISLGVLGVALLSASPVLAATVTGTITNRTTGKPSAGDTVAAVNMSVSMDEFTKATSDTNGVFHIVVPDNAQIMFHIRHHGAEYFKVLPPRASTIQIDVYDAAAKIAGITSEAMVYRFSTNTSGQLHVSENFFLKNDSTPPRTEFGGNTFEFYIPRNANLVQSVASTANGLPTTVKLVPLDAASGHYAFNFPLRPGETYFQIIYTMPYTGKQSFSAKPSMPTGDVAVVLPKSMQFDGGAQFQPIEPDADSLSYDAHNPTFGQPIQFTITGTGALPQNSDTSQGTPNQASSGTPAASQPSSTTDTRPGGGLGVPDDPGGTNDPWAKYKGWILGGLGLALAIGAGIMLRSGPAPLPAAPSPQPVSDITGPAGTYIEPTLATAPPPQPPANHLLQALKEEFFALESDRISGRLTDAEYVEQKAAFDIVLRRALNRASTQERPA